MCNTFFQTAVVDYRYLKNRKYSEKAALKLVGDHYRLSKAERNCLLRGIVEENVLTQRKNKLISAQEIESKQLGIDWYNVLITIESYLKGYILFFADDGVIRDSSATHGSYRQSQITVQAIDTICAALIRLKPGTVKIVIDSPISYSKKMAENLDALFKSRLPMPFTISLIHSADFELKNFHGIVASSDSVIIDNAQKVFDLSCFCLRSYLHFQPQRIDNLTFKK